VSSGISDISKNRTPFSGSPNQRYADPSSGPGTAFRGPSDNRPGFVFRAGVFGRKKLTDRTDVTVGVQYAYYSDNIRVGDRRDSLLNFTSYLADQVSLSSYYRGASQYSYTNRYHFVEIPVSYQLRLTNSIKHPIHWNAGLAVTQLISTTALIYDTAFNGLYYNAEDFFRKTHVHAFTGFTFTIRGKAWEWSVGPELQFALTNLSRNSNRDGKFLQYTGLSASVILPKKQ
jgi:hypothetical protein